MSSRKTTQKSEHNSSTFILPLDLCDIIDDQDEHIVLTLRLLKELIRDNHRLLMALAERSLGRDSDIPTATRAGAGAELRTLPVAALQLDSVILDDQDDHLVLTIRLPKEAIRKNLNMLMALSDACVAWPQQAASATKQPAGGFFLAPRRLQRFNITIENHDLILGESGMAIGTVRWFSGQKGYGFIQPDTGSNDVFVHVSAVQQSGLSGLPDGARLTFDIVPNRGKESAENLRLMIHD
jgi:cold shock protein